MKPARSFWKKARILLLLLLIIGISIQFIRPRLDNPPVTGDLQAPAEVKAILKRACYDCHSNQTKLAWFDQPAPAYWLVADHVKQGRKVLNFSNWDSLTPAQQAGKLYESLNQIEYGVMPIKQYTMFHHGGVITPEEIAILKRYIGTLVYKPVPDTARQRASLEQYEKWILAKENSSGAIKDEYDGISYQDLAKFRDWRAISTTERFDNGSLRLILGNDVVQKAIREGHTNPWPTGAVFAKVAWDQSPDTSGVIHPGAFRQVEFMIRDADKYASTQGWGWARWVGGLAMKPYGKNASFTTECINCHKPMVPNDQTFTFPMVDTLGLHDPISTFPAGRVVFSDHTLPLPDTVGTHPLTGKVITTLVNTREGTMSTLYGNDTAIYSARLGGSYLPGSVIALVTWSQRDDAHWFGGRIPNAVRSIEILRFPPANTYIAGNADGPASYERYEGAVPVAVKSPGQADMQRRVDYIKRLKAAVLP